ncbi:longevity assurance proteins LAG1/LAC1 [Mycena latifolia]|nr:longevity assurance proteins LAG1/LAC1 [Mycena latifolia]
MISTARPKPKGPLDDPAHHIGAALAPPSPTPPALVPPHLTHTHSHNSMPSVKGGKPTMLAAGVKAEDVSPWLRWAVSPHSALALLMVPPLLAIPTSFILPFLPEAMRPASNPFTAFFLLSHPAPFPLSPSSALRATTAPEYTATTQLYNKGPADVLLLGWTVVLFSFLRLVFAHTLFPALARRWGITKEGKLVRFGEQGYAVVYWAVFGAWGVYIMSTSRTWWFSTSFIWRDYPHDHLSGAMKRYYLCQVGFWLQQALVLILGLEKRRSDHWELVLHHVITVWMVSWSYIMNVTLLGNAVFISMDIPDTGLALSKLLNYLQFDRAKVVSLGVFTVVWTYFRHYISIRILWSLRYEFDLVPKHAQIFSPSQDLWMAPWMRDQMFYTLCILQALNLFWYYLIIRIIVRSVMTSKTDDNRSDDEDDEDEQVESAPAEKGLPPSVGRDNTLPAEKPMSGGRSKKGAGARTGAGGGLTLPTPAPAANGKAGDVEAGKEE